MNRINPTFSLKAFAAVFFTLMSSAYPANASNNNSTKNNEYLVGAGIYDITGPAAETGAFGYAASQTMKGIQDRLYSHAYIIGDPVSNKRVVFVTADMGAMFKSVKLEVIKRLQSEFGYLYSDENVMLTATHTHVANGGISHQKLYQIASGDDSLAGYSQMAFEAVVSGIVSSIKRAHNNLELGTLSVATKKVKGATRNRSLVPYFNNLDSSKFDTTVNETMTQLRLDSADGEPLGLINWFAIHPTSFSKKFLYLSADSKGYAQLKAEKALGTDITKGKTFVAGFANSDLGDVVSAGGNADSSKGFEGDSNELVNAVRDGEIQFKHAKKLWFFGDKVSGPIDYRARWVDLKGYLVGSKYTQGAGPQLTCNPARGYSFAVGAENGPSDIPGLYEGMTRGSFSLSDAKNKIDQSFAGTLIRTGMSIVSNLAQDDCQAEKAVLLPTGGFGWLDTTQPVQLFRIGNLALVAMPGEPTTMSGRRLRAVVSKQLADAGVEHVIIASIANNYLGYITTREEYAKQHYEGASTEYGPYQLAAFLQEYDALSRAMKVGEPVIPRALPEARNPKKFRERAGVLFDDKLWFEKWGQALVQPQSSYKKGETVNAEFRSGHPKNNLRHQSSFLFVQRYDKGQWVNYLTDRDWDTTYTWKRTFAAYSRAIVTWRIGKQTPTGMYRLVQMGDWKNGLNGEIKPYTGYSRVFEVKNP